MGATFSPPGGEIAAGFALTLAHANTTGTSTIFYTTDGSDPRAIGGGAGATAVQYGSAVTLNATTRIRSRVRNVNGNTTIWSALREADFNVSGALAAMRFTEVMYHPEGDAAFENEDDFEFIEFKNTDASALRLDGCKLDGVEFAFATGTSVPAGSFVVLVANPAAFAARYPAVVIGGAYFKNLSNSGEKLRLLNADSTTIASVQYNNDVPWPVGADGIGYSLVNRNLAGDPDEAANWRASTNIHGSPGSDDPAPGYGIGLVFNEVLAKSNTPLEDAIEIANPTAGAVDISGWWLSDSVADPLLATPRDALKKYKIPAGTVVAAGGFKVFYESQFSPAAPTAEALVPFALSQDRDQVYLSSADSAGSLTGHIVGEKFGASENNVAFGRFTTSTAVVLDGWSIEGAAYVGA